MKAIKDLIAWLDGADHDICRLCKRVNPHHLNCTSCQEHDDRKKVIKVGSALPDWPSVSGKELWLSLCDFYACSDCHDRRYPECNEKKCPAKGIYHLITDGMRSIGVEIREEKDGE